MLMRRRSADLADSKAAKRAQPLCRPNGDARSRVSPRGADGDTNSSLTELFRMPLADGA